MKFSEDTNIGIIQVRSKKCLVIAWCLLSINVITANASSNTTEKDSNLDSKKINWAGPYIGGYVGGAWGQSNFNTDAGTVTNTSYFSSTANILSVNQNGSKTLEPNAFIGGVQVGNNWVLHNLIYGLVFDFGSFHLHSSNNEDGISYPTSPATYSLQTSMKTNWLFTARGRLGFIPGTSLPLVYATGGLAVTKSQMVNNFSDNSFGNLAVGGTSNSSVKTGWTVGAGLELPLTKNFTINSEYMYVNFGSVTATSSIYNSAEIINPVASFISPFLTSSNLSANLFKVGLNYKV